MTYTKCIPHGESIQHINKRKYIYLFRRDEPKTSNKKKRIKKKWNCEIEYSFQKFSFQWFFFLSFWCVCVCVLALAATKPSATNHSQPHKNLFNKSVSFMTSSSFIIAPHNKSGAPGLAIHIRTTHAIIQYHTAPRICENGRHHNMKRTVWETLSVSVFANEMC